MILKTFISCNVYPFFKLPNWQFGPNVVKRVKSKVKRDRLTSYQELILIARMLRNAKVKKCDRLIGFQELILTAAVKV